VFSTARAVFSQLNATRIVTAIFFGGVISLFALAASQRYNRANASFSRHSFFYDPFADRPLLVK
jgi:hypothetical protein